MSNKDDIKKFLTDLNKSEEGKKMLQDLNNSNTSPIKIVPEALFIEDSKLEIKKGKKDKKKDAKWWSKVFNKDKLKKPDRVGVIYLRNNGKADLMEVQTKNGFFNVDGKPYHEDRDCVYILTKERIPLLVVREWDMIPLGTKKWDDETMREKFSELEQHVLKGIRAAELVKSGGGLDGKFTTKQIILWGLVLLVGAVILMNYL